MRFLLDMNLSPRLVSILSEAGLESLHWASVGPPEAPDAVIMTFARDHDYVVLTYDLDFSAILAGTKSLKPSVVQIRSGNISPEHLGPAIVPFLRQMATELENGAVLTIDLSKSRLRLLPLKAD
jgi:predicted nuclease of predicted toxin-antitoxin system